MLTKTTKHTSSIRKVHDISRLGSAYLPPPARTHASMMVCCSSARSGSQRSPQILGTSADQPDQATAERTCRACWCYSSGGVSSLGFSPPYNIIIVLMGVSENRSTLFWGPKDPTIQGTILGSPIFGNSHVETQKVKALNAKPPTRRTPRGSQRRCGCAGCYPTGLPHRRHPSAADENLAWFRV